MTNNKQKEEIWNSIQLVYETCGFNRLETINGVTISSRDNYYLISKVKPDRQPLYIKIEKDYNLIDMWSGGNSPVNYKIWIDDFHRGDDDVEVIPLIKSILQPYLRDAKLTKIGI
jgi:hypothetical protein